MRTIAIVNQKGGTGKTTVAINLASALAEVGKKILLVDMDPQSHCAVGLAVPEEQIEQSIYDVLTSGEKNETIKLSEILWQISDRLELAPASIDLTAFEQQMAGIPDSECCLRDTLRRVEEEYEYAVIDCPPAVGLLTFNALRAATDVIVPVETGYFALHGLSKQLETLKILCERCNQHVEVKILTSMYDVRTKMAREILSELRSHFSDRMFKTIINFNTKIKEAASFGQPIGEYDSASKGHKDFCKLAEEVIGSEARLQRREMVNTLASQLELISTSADELIKAAKPRIKTIPIPKTEKAPVKQKRFDRPELTVEGQVAEAPQKQTATDSSGRPASPECFAAARSLPTQPDTSLATAPKGTSEKLSDYYGVNQVGDAIVFITLYPRASEVQIAGDFNNWQPEKTPMERVGESGVWQTKIKLPQGKYCYRLVVDGRWQQDPYNEMAELNPYGEFNSVLEVK